MELNDFDIQVLKEVANFKENEGWIASREIELKFGADEYEEPVKKSIFNILSLNFIKGHGSPDPDGTHGVYSITPSGKQFLEEKASVPRIGSITNSNVAINSENVIQNLKINDPELKEKIKELEEAIKAKNPSLIKKIFNYILDKSVDVGIALLLRGMGG